MRLDWAVRGCPLSVGVGARTAVGLGLTVAAASDCFAGTSAFVLGVPTTDTEVAAVGRTAFFCTCASGASTREACVVLGDGGGVGPAAGVVG